MPTFGLSDCCALHHSVFLQRSALIGKHGKLTVSMTSSRRAQCPDSVCCSVKIVVDHRGRPEYASQALHCLILRAFHSCHRSFLRRRIPKASRRTWACCMLACRKSSADQWRALAVQRNWDSTRQRIMSPILAQLARPVRMSLCPIAASRTRPKSSRACWEGACCKLNDNPRTLIDS